MPAIKKVTSDLLDFKFLNRIPFIRILIPLIAGILLSEVLNISQNINIIVIIIFFICILLLNIFISYKVQWLWGIFATFFVFFTGVLLMSFRINSIEHVDLPKHEIKIRGYLEKNIVEKENLFQSILVINPYEKAKFFNKKVKILVYLQKDSSFQLLRAGDELEIEAYIQKIKKYGNPGEFDYEMYMATKGIYHYFFASKEKVSIKKSAKHNIFTISENIRFQLLKILEKYIPDKEKFSVVSAMVLGYKEELSQDTKIIFSNSGAQHILAVSGLHVGIIYLILTFLFFPLNKVSPVTRLILMTIGFCTQSKNYYLWEKN